MKNIKTLLKSSLAGLALFACSKDDPIIEYVAVPGETVVETVVETPITNTIGSDGGITKISEDQTWSNNQIHIIRGKVVIMPGTTLTVDAGTIIKAERVKTMMPRHLLSLEEEQ